MGGGAERVAVARRLGLDGLRLGAASQPTKRARADLLLLALASLLLRGGERVTLLGSGAPPSAAARCSTAWRGVGARRGDGGAAAGSSRCRAIARLVLIGDLLAPLEATRALVASLPRAA